MICKLQWEHQQLTADSLIPENMDGHTSTMQSNKREVINVKPKKRNLILLKIEIKTNVKNPKTEEKMRNPQRNEWVRVSYPTAHLKMMSCLDECKNEK